MNIWRRFKALIPGDELIIAKVESIDTLRGTSQVLPLSGGTMTVRGTSVQVGSFAFVRGDVIEGKAPDLGTPVALEV